MDDSTPLAIAAALPEHTIVLPDGLQAGMMRIEFGFDTFHKEYSRHV